MRRPPTEPLSYARAGVDIDRGNRLVERIRGLVRDTHRPGVLAGVGGFGALFELPEGYRHPVLVSGTDGVGTKLRLAIDHDRHEGVGIDLVAMCVNDVLALGAEPLFFLDYFASGRLDEEVAARVVAGIADGCRQAGAALVGGETAEMPGMYPPGDYDLAGFCVGVVEREAIIDGARVVAGDRLIGLPSSGPHSNGFSLIRKILEVTGTDPARERLEDRPLLDWLLEPTRIYVRTVLALLGEVPVRAIAHITGGGLPENLPRVLPDGLGAHLEAGAWTRPRIFSWLQEAGAIAEPELLRTFNCGVGLVLCVPAAEADRALAHLTASGESPIPLGSVVPVDAGAPRVVIA